MRAEDERLCALVVMGVNEGGQKRLLAIEDGVRESTHSWREVLLGLKARGLTQAPRLAVGDGVLGFWAVLEEIFPGTRAMRCSLSTTFRPSTGWHLRTTNPIESAFSLAPLQEMKLIYPLQGIDRAAAGFAGGQA